MSSLGNKHQSQCGATCSSVNEYRKSMTRLECCQVIVLLLCLAVVGVIGTLNFIRANENELRQWKPERKLYAIEYDAEDSDSNYQMPSLIVTAWFTISRQPYAFSEFESGIEVTNGNGPVQFNMKSLDEHISLG